MTITITHTWHNGDRPYTIYAKLKEKLGREPTQAELIADVHRILNRSKADERRRQLKARSR